MKVLITGGTGRVGANLAIRLLTSGHDIRAFVYPADTSRAGKLAGFERVETLEGDLRNFADCQKAVDGVDAIYHLAAAFGGPFDNRDYLAINGGGTLNLLEAVRAQRPKLHRFVYACTEAIYWQLTDRSPNLAGRESRYFANAIRESDVSPYLQMPYFLTKRIGEQLVMAYHHQHGIPSVSFRFTTIIEPSEFLNADGLPTLFLLSTAHKAWSNQNSPDSREQAMLDNIRKLWTGEEKLLLSLNPNGVPFRQHYTDVRDIALGLEMALSADAAVGQEMNLGGAAILDWAEIVPWLADRHNMEYVSAKIPSPNYFVLDLTKTRSILGFEPQHDFQSILATAEAMARGEETDVIPTGVPWQSRSDD